MYNSFVEWTELGDESASNKWDYRKIRRKIFLVRCIELAKYFIRTNV